MGSRELSRRNVLKTGATLASVGVVGSLSGCSGLLDSDSTETEGGKSASGAAAYIPARANVAMGMSFDALLNDDAIRGAVNSALERQATEDSMLPSSVEDALDMVEEKAEEMFEEDVDGNPRNLNKVVLFGESTDDSGEDSDYVGWLTYTDWSQDELQTLIEEESEGEVTTEEYGDRDTTVYVTEDEDESMERVAILSDGTIVLGRAGATNDVIDIRDDNGEEISGDLLSAWNATSGDYATVAMDITPEDLPDGQAEAAAPTVRNIKYAYGSVYADGDVRGIRFNLETGSEQDAKDVKTFIDGQMTLEKEKTEDEEMKQFIEDTTVTTDGTTVVITNEVDIDKITPVIEQLVTLFVSGVGRSSSGFGSDGASVSA
jgi:hypothetical protein